MEIIGYVILGVIVIVGFALWVNRVSSPRDHTSAYIMVFIFAAYGIGYSLMQPDEVYRYFDYTSHKWVIIPVCFCLLSFFETYYKKSVISFEFVEYIVLFGIFTGVLYLLGEVEFKGYSIGAVVYYVMLMVTVGSFLAFFGPLIATVNIVGLLMQIFSGHGNVFSVKSIFDIYEMIGINIEAVKYIAYALSTALGLYQIDEIADYVHDIFSA